jgi:hypothetical protein
MLARVIIPKEAFKDPKQYNLALLAQFEDVEGLTPKLLNGKFALLVTLLITKDDWSRIEKKHGVLSNPNRHLIALIDHVGLTESGHIFFNNWLQKQPKIMRTLPAFTETPAELPEDNPFETVYEYLDNFFETKKQLKPEQAFQYVPTVLMNGYLECLEEIYSCSINKRQRTETFW